MKTIYNLIIAFFAVGISFASCSDDAPFSTASPDDDPRILDPIFPDRSNGELATFSNISRDVHLSIKLTVTPADYSTVSWYIDGETVESGTDSDKELDIALLAGTYNLKILVETTTGKTTSREGIVQVNPLSDDPWSTAQSYERIVSPGSQAYLYGNNLDKVASIAIGGRVIDEVSFADNSLTYQVPSDMEEGEFRLVLRDAQGLEYGGNKVRISRQALVVSGADRATAGMPWTLTGINLDRLASLTIGDQTVTAFTSLTSTEATFVCPSLVDGEYQLSGTSVDGNSIRFLSGDEMTDHCTVTISTEQILWQGHHYVSWDLPDTDPNKTFNLIPIEVFAGIKAGSILCITYSVEPTAEYHQLQPATGWWTNLADKIDFTENGVYELTLTQDILDKILAEGGFICVGHGYYVDLVTLK